MAVLTAIFFLGILINISNTLVGHYMKKLTNKKEIKNGPKQIEDRAAAGEFIGKDVFEKYPTTIVEYSSGTINTPLVSTVPKFKSYSS